MSRGNREEECEDDLHPWRIRGRESVGNAMDNGYCGLCAREYI